MQGKIFINGAAVRHGWAVLAVMTTYGCSNDPGPDPDFGGAAHASSTGSDPGSGPAGDDASGDDASAGEPGGPADGPLMAVPPVAEGGHRGIMQCPTKELPRYSPAPRGQLELSADFSNTCASCHDLDGQGGPAAPKLAGTTLDFEAYRSIVRDGSPKMPAFSDAAIDEATLRADYDALILGTDAGADSDPPTRTWSAQEREEVLNAGLHAWWTPDAEGLACASCHSADAVDLAVIGHDDRTIRRRALKHLDAAASQAIVDLVHAQRFEYGLSEVCSPDWRVFQPGGEVIAGDSWAQRDDAFAELVEDQGLRITGEPIEDLNAAEVAYEQLLNFEYRRLPIPIPLPHWTSDHERGEDHRNLDDWITEFGVVASTPADQETSKSLARAYLADPTHARLVEYMDHVSVTAVPLEDYGDRYNRGAREALWIGKWRATQHAAHLFRLELLGREGWFDYGPTLYGVDDTSEYENPMWVVEGAGQLCDRDGCKHPSVSELGPIPAGLAEELEPVDQLHDDRALGRFVSTWGALGWLYDHSLQHEGLWSTRLKYWRSDMKRQGFPFFLMWMRATSSAYGLGDSSSLRGSVSSDFADAPPITDGTQWVNFVVTIPRADDGEARNRVARRILDNTLRLRLLYLRRALDEGSTVYEPGWIRDGINDAIDELQKAGDVAPVALADEVIGLVNAASVR